MRYAFHCILGSCMSKEALSSSGRIYHLLCAPLRASSIDTHTHRLNGYDSPFPPQVR